MKNGLVLLIGLGTILVFAESKKRNQKFETLSVMASESSVRLVQDKRSRCLIVRYTFNREVTILGNKPVVEILALDRTERFQDRHLMKLIPIGTKKILGSIFSTQYQAKFACNEKKHALYYKVSIDIDRVIDQNANLTIEDKNKGISTSILNLASG